MLVLVIEMLGFFWFRLKQKKTPELNKNRNNKIKLLYQQKICLLVKLFYKNLIRLILTNFGSIWRGSIYKWTNRFLSKLI